nr:uncharacterized protein LOC109185694 [Ipomoea batatas]
MVAGSTRSGTTSATGFCPNASSKRPTASATVTVIRALSSSCVNGCPTGNASCDASCVMALGSARCWDGCIDSPEGACALPLLSVLRKSSFGRLPALRVTTMVLDNSNQEPKTKAKAFRIESPRTAPMNGQPSVARIAFKVARGLADAVNRRWPAWEPFSPNWRFILKRAEAVRSRRVVEKACNFCLAGVYTTKGELVDIIVEMMRDGLGWCKRKGLGKVVVETNDEMVLNYVTDWEGIEIMDEEIRMVWGWRGGTGMEYRVIWDLGGNTQGFLPLNIEFLCDCRKVMVVQIWEYMKETSES